MSNSHVTPKRLPIGGALNAQTAADTDENASETVDPTIAAEPMKAPAPQNVGEIISKVTGAKPLPETAPVTTKNHSETRGDPNAVLHDQSTVDPATQARLDQQVAAAEAQAAQHAEALHDQALANAAETMANASEKKFIFLSKYPSLTIYASCGEVAYGRDGARIATDTRFDFKNGVLTVNAVQAKAIRESKRCGTMFRESTEDTVAVAQRRALAQRQAQMRTNVQTGTTASDAANEAKFLTENAGIEHATHLLTDL